MKTSLHVITLLVLSASPLALPLNAQEDLEISEFFESTAEVGNYRVFANVFPDETGKVFDFIFYIRQAETDEPYTGGVTILFIHSGSDRIERSVEKGAVDEPNIYRTRHAFEKEGLYFVRLHFSPMGEKLEAQFPLTVGHPGAKVSGTVVTAILLGIVGLLWYGGIRSRFDILRIRFINRLVKMRPFQFYLRLPLVLMCLVLIPAGLFGNQYAGMNSATIVIWVIWWTAIVFAITLLGKVWCTACPWLAVADWIQKLTFWRKRDKSLSLNLKWPVKLRNIWLAIFFFVFLTWIEIGHDITISPRATAYLAIAMFVLTIGSGLIFERNSFCRYGCFVGRISGMYALFSPVELRSKDKEVCKTCRTKDCIRGNGKGYPCPTFEYPGTMDLNTYCILCTECIKTCPHENITVRMRPFAADLYKSMRGSADEAYMCLALFGLTFLHTITMTPPWFNLMERLQIMTGWGYVELFTILMAILALSPVSIHYGFSWVSRRFSGRLDIPKKTVFINFAYALLPVCLFFHMGHNVEHLFLEGQYVIPAVSDPFGWQWDLFGTADWTVNPTLSVTTTLYIQFALVLIGLIFGLLIAYKVAFRTFSRVGAIKGFIPMAFLLVVFTLINGWLLAKPMISRLGL